MLPFLQPKKIASVIVAKMKPSGQVMPEREEGRVAPELLSAAEDLISAIHMKDAEAAAEALHTAFVIVDSMPHEEGDHEEEGEVES